MAPWPPTAHHALCRTPHGHPDSTGRPEGLCHPVPRAVGTRSRGLSPQPRRELGTLPPQWQRARCPDGSGLQVRGRLGCLLAGVPPEPSGPLRGGCSPPEGAERGRAREVWGSLRGLPTFPARQRQAAPGLGGGTTSVRCFILGVGWGCRKIAHKRARASAPSHR